MSSSENIVDVFDELFDDDVVQLHLGDDRFRTTFLSDAVNLKVNVIKHCLEDRLSSIDKSKETGLIMF